MSTTYPAQIDTNQSLPTVIDNLTPVQGKVFNQLRDAVIAIEATLGAQANGVYSSAGSRISNLENIVGNLQIVSLSQDIGGTLGSPLVVGIQGKPVSNAAPQTSEVLTWNGIAWVPLPPAGLIDVVLNCDLSGTKLCQIVVGLQGNPVAAGTPTIGELLKWNGTEWIAGVSPPVISSFTIIPMVAGNFTTSSATPVIIGASDINMSTFPASIPPLTRSVHFKALIAASSPSVVTQIRLVDATDGNVVITGTVSATSSTSFVLFDSGPLTVGTSAGQIRTDVHANYTVQLAMTSGSGTAICANARIEITYS